MGLLVVRMCIAGTALCYTNGIDLGLGQTLLFAVIVSCMVGGPHQDKPLQPSHWVETHTNLSTLSWVHLFYHTYLCPDRNVPVILGRYQMSFIYD